MFVTKSELVKLQNLNEVSEALLSNQRVWMDTGTHGWVEVQQVNLYKKPNEYHIGDEPPYSENNHKVC